MPMCSKRCPSFATKVPGDAHACALGLCSAQDKLVADNDPCWPAIWALEAAAQRAHIVLREDDRCFCDEAGPCRYCEAHDALIAALPPDDPEPSEGVKP